MDFGSDAMISVQTSADFANAVLNHPAVRPDVADVADGAIDLTRALDERKCLVLGGQHGIFVVTCIAAGIWEVHTAILPEGRGAWAREFAQKGASYMFHATDAAEILTRVPQGHDGAERLTKYMGFRYQFTSPPECLFRGEKVPCHIWSLSIQDWSLSAPGAEERGARFHEWLNRSLSGQPHFPDRDHNRIVGIAIEMIAAGQVMKGIVFYNRWAISVRHSPISLVGEAPVQVRFDAGILTMRDGRISVEPCH